LSLLFLCGFVSAAEMEPPNATPVSKTFYATSTTQLFHYSNGNLDGGDLAWWGVYKGTKLTAVERSGHWFKVKRLNPDDSFLWFHSETVIPADGVEKAAVITDDPKMYVNNYEPALFDGPALQAGTLAFILERDKGLCHANIGGQNSPWMDCAALSTDPAYVQSAETLE